MSEEIKEELSKKEYKKVGDMLLELIAGCPHIPEDLKGKDDGILYQTRGTNKCISVLTVPGAKYVSHDIAGGFTAQVSFQIGYKSFPTTNEQRINAQAVVDSIMDWLEDVENLPKLSGGRIIKEITASNSFASIDDVGDDKSTVFAADAVMQYRKKGV